MECFSTAELFLHGVTDTCSFLDVPFFYSKGVLGVFSYSRSGSDVGVIMAIMTFQCKCPEVMQTEDGYTLSFGVALLLLFSVK